MNKTDFSMAKAFLSRQVDKFRPPYGRHDISRPRQTAFFASTNQGEPFKDESGNRRFWPIDATTCDPDGLARVRNQIWAETTHFLDAGEAWWLPPEIEIIAQGEQAKRTASHPLVPAVREAVKGLGNVIEIKTLLTLWEVPKRDWVRVSMEAAKALREMEWTSAQRRENGVKAMRWYAPEEPET